MRKQPQLCSIGSYIKVPYYFDRPSNEYQMVGFSAKCYGEFVFF